MSSKHTIDTQRLFIELMLSDAESYVRVQNIYNPDNFDRSIREVATFIMEYSNKYSAIPTFEQVNALSTQHKFKPIPTMTDAYNEWFLVEFEKFTKGAEIERAILKSADLLEKGDTDPIEALIKAAIQISLTKDMGTDYYASPRERLMKIKDKSNQSPTGWKTLDFLLYGGMNRGELQIFCGGSGSGKSLFLQNMAVNWSQAGLTGVYLSLELSEELCSMRIDSMISDTKSKDVLRNIDDVELKVRIAGKKNGALRVKYMPAQSTVNDIRSYLRELQIQHGIKVDYIMVDYLDLLMPVSTKVSPSDLFIKDKYVSEELRNLAKELNILLITASQLNRSSIDEAEIDHSMISGGISKIMTADNVFAILTSRQMRERGKYQLQLLKTRSSAGVGNKMDLDFDIGTLRIVDNGEDSAPGGMSPNSIVNQIKAKTKVLESISVDDETGEVKQISAIAPNISSASQSTNLKNMLANLKNKTY